jgi:NADPH:quinone reductase-like Zn-dependent oxidoreductase
LLSRLGRKKMLFMIARSNQEDLLFLSHLLDQRRVVPVIDKRYPLAEVPQAMVYLIEEHPRGKVIITP